MKANRTVRLLILCVLAASTFNVASHSQNTIAPDPIDSLVANYWTPTVFADAPSIFHLGHQWSPALLDKLNSALRMTVTNDPWGYLPDNIDTLLNRLGEGHNDTNYLVWADPLHHTPGPYGDIFRSAWIGMRWEPAENAGLGRSWTPRDDDAWPFSFAAKYHGTIPGSPSNTNYQRFVLSPISMPSNPVRVLVCKLNGKHR